MTWPPDLASLKDDLGDEYEAEDRDDDRLQRCLDAAVAVVERVHEEGFDFGGSPASPDDLPEPDADMTLGTLRLAGRWFVRRRSPEGLLEMGEMGGARVPSFDPDIDRMLRFGKYAPMRFA